MPGGPRGHRPAASRSRRHNAAGAGSGTQGALCLEHGAPSCARCRSLGWGISRCCRAGHEGHAGSSGGPGCPIALPRVAPGRQVLVPEARRTGAAALSSWLGRARPDSQALPSSGLPATRRCTAPPRVLGTRPSPALGPHAPRPAKRQAPNQANRGDPGGVGHRTTGGGAVDPLSPQPAGGGGGATTRGRSPHPPPPARGPRGRQRVGGQQTPSCPSQRGGGRWPEAGPLIFLHQHGGLGGVGGAAGLPPATPPQQSDSPRRSRMFSAASQRP